MDRGRVGIAQRRQRQGLFAAFGRCGGHDGKSSAASLQKRLTAQRLGFILSQ